MGTIQEGTDFLLTPYKVYLSILVQAFMEEKTKETPTRVVGRFSKLIMRLTQSLDSRYAAVRSTVIAYKLECLLPKCDKKVEEIRKQGLSSLMELISSIKALIAIHRSSLLGLFNRRMFLYFDKLSFNSLSLLYEEFLAYTNKDMEPQDSNITTMGVGGESTMLMHGGDETNADQLWRTCPKQIHYFLSKQINLINVDEKKALNPSELFAVISNARGAESKAPVQQQSASATVACSGLNELNFLRYVNSLRINEFAGARDALIAYFDSSPNIASGKCWAVYNLASLHYHFGHDRLALDAIEECISAAQESNDEKCLEFSLLLLAKLILRKKETSDSDEDLVSLLHHIQAKASKLELHFLSASAALHYEQLVGSTVKRSASSASLSDILAVKFSLNDLLLASYSSKAALFSSIGASDMAALTSQLLLHLYTVDPIGDELYYRINENTAIGLRNVSLYLWKNLGEYDAACDILVSVTTEVFSSYRSAVNSIWKKALAEIEFEHSLFSLNWKEALMSIATIKTFDSKEAKLRLAELKLKQGNREEAYKIVCELLLAKKGLSENFKVRVMLMKSRILKNFSILLTAIDEAKRNNFFGLEATCIIELSGQLHELGLSSQAIHVLRRHFLPILANGTCSDIGKACYVYAISLKALSKESEGQTACNEHLHRSLSYNEKALKKFKQLNDIDYLKKSLTLHATIYNELGNNEKRNYFARQLRIICTH